MRDKTRVYRIEIPDMMDYYARAINQEDALEIAHDILFHTGEQIDIATLKQVSNVTVLPDTERKYYA